MDWQEALEISNKAWDEEAPKIGKEENGHSKISWKYLHLLTNIPSKHFQAYNSRIESGELLVGPAAHGLRGQIHRNPECIGLYRTQAVSRTSRRR